MGQVVLWFKNDLRLHDNYVVDRAQQLIKSGKAKEVLPVYCFDPRHYQSTPWGHQKTGSYRAQFLLESILDLKQNLRSIGSDLLVKLGKPEDVIPGLVTDGATIVTQEDFASEELLAIDKVKKAIGNKATLEQIWDSTLYHLHDLPFAEDLNDMQDVFTPFKNKIEGSVDIRKLVRTPGKGDFPLSSSVDKAALAHAPSKVEDLNEVVPKSGQQLATPQKHPKAALDFKGGETAALQRVQYYLWDSDLLADYFNIRNGMLGGDYSTKFSPWFAHGCLSPRYVYHEIGKYENQRKKNKSTYWVNFEMTWRDYFRFFLIKHGSTLFHEYGISGGKRDWNESEEDFQSWKDGKTGMPLIDANMRELKETGFMSNRGRQNVASYLVLDMGVDWRKGADWFESVLQDYDVASNWGNWCSAAGLTGGRVSHFNPLKQSKDYDEDGKYVKHWLPELARVPVEKVHQPWQMTKEEQEASGVVVGRDYPHPKKSRFSNSGSGDRGGHGRGRSGRGGRGGRGGRDGKGGGGRSGGRGPKGPQD